MSRPRLTEAEIRPDDLFAESLRTHRADVERLVAKRDSFVEVACPACGTADGRQRWRKDQVDFLECPSCRTVYVSPRPSPAVLDEHYRTSENYKYWTEVIFPASEDARRAKIFAPRAERVVEIARRVGAEGGVLVDVGAGFGTFCEEVARLGAFERVIALEPEPHLAAACRSKGLEVVEAPVESASLPVERVDVVTNFEVIEHLFDPASFVEQCARLLSPGGLLVLTCPNGQGFDVEVLGEQSGTVAAEHLNYFNPDSLGGLLERCGFEVVERQTPGRLDAELVRKQVLAGELDLSAQPFLQRVLVDEWDRVGERFQDFLADNGLSSNMWVVGRRR
jgi:2-polyprenyl-3-methyl-5-hydroxy-6-metoxy-1,4-benzoquinol methylase